MNIDLEKYIYSLDSNGLIGIYANLYNTSTLGQELKIKFLIDYIESLRVNPKELKLGDIIFNLVEFKFTRVDSICKSGIYLSPSTNDYQALKISQRSNAKDTFNTPKSLINMRCITVEDINDFMFNIVCVKHGRIILPQIDFLKLKLKLLVNV